MFSTEELSRRQKLNEQGYWVIPDGLDTSNFNFDWRPNSFDRPYIHQFGTQHQKTGGPKFVVPENEGIKYQDSQHAIKLPDQENRSWRPLVANANMDFSWHPDDTEPPFIYVFGNQWYDVGTMPTYQYRVKGATEKKYINEVKATLLSDKSKWEIPTDIDDTAFDYSWVPNPYDPPLIHEFGTQWQTNGGPKYIVENATLIKYYSIQKVIKLTNMRNWRMVENVENFDFSWHPDNREPPMMYEFGTQWQIAGGPIYVTKGAVHKKSCKDQTATRKSIDERSYRPLVNNIEFDYTWHPDPNDPPYIYVFGNQWYDAEIMPTLLYRVKGATEKKYVNDVRATLTHKLDNWEIPNDIDDSGFDYSWCPNPNDPPYIYQFGTQWQKTGGPKYIVPNASETKYVSIQKVYKKANMRNWRIIEPIDKESFDFTWHPDETEESFNYIFGNIFHSPEIMPTIMFKGKKAKSNKYCTEQSASLEIKTFIYEDTIYDELMSNKFDTAYARFTKNNEKIEYDLKSIQASIHLLGDDAFVPKGIRQYLYDKLTDYDHVIDYKINNKMPPLDIIFFSNGESCADDNFAHLLNVTKNLPNRVLHLDGVKGRVNSQHAAATLSNTPWYFLVNAKLRVNENFDFSWKPNIYKSRRHYVFTATNPVNGLEYGHQAIVANNKILTLNTVVTGLDFTMDSPNEVTNINSGISTYNTSEWDAWRTAFRECIKLSYYNDVSSKERLHVWLTVAEGNFSQYSIQGAKDAVEYFNLVNGDLEKLMLSYDWEWLWDYFNK